MDKIILAIMQQLRQGLPELSYIDEDYGQLESSDEDGYPVTFPAVLIENPDTDWETIGFKAQTGTTFISFKLAIDCYDDTHVGSGTEDKISERYAINRKIYDIFQDCILDERMEGMNRVKSKSYTMDGGIKVYETIFCFDFHDGQIL